uniref:Uncharacterized protein n=1 Tax=Bionectria ochroleuca TaxID=29856 RepID=A0A8H7N2J3_BIOOC
MSPNFTDLLHILNYSLPKLEEGTSAEWRLPGRRQRVPPHAIFASLLLGASGATSEQRRRCKYNNTEWRSKSAGLKLHYSAIVKSPVAVEIRNYDHRSLSRVVRHPHCSNAKLHNQLFYRLVEAIARKPRRICHLLPFAGDGPIALYDTADTGKLIKAAIMHWDGVVGKHLLGTSGDVTGDQMIATFQKVFPIAGEGASWQKVAPETWAGYIEGPGKMREVMVDNRRLIAEYGYFIGESYNLTRRVLEDDLTTWEQHLRKSSALRHLQQSD